MVRLKNLVALAAIAMTLLAVASLVGDLAYPLEVLANFRVQMFLFAGVLAAVAAAIRHVLATLVLLGCLVLNGRPIMPYLKMSTAAVAEQPHRLRVVTYNMRNRSTDVAALFELLERERADIAVLTELPPGFGATLDWRGAAFPHRTVLEREGSFEVLAISRHPLGDVRIERSPADWTPRLSFNHCASEAACVRVIALHAPRPVPTANLKALRDQAIREVASAARSAGRAVVIGDLNLTPWSPVFARLLSDGGLHDTAHGLSPTWFSSSPFLGLRIDHILISDGIDATSWRVGPDLGSDHLPVIADLAIRP